MRSFDSKVAEGAGLSSFESEIGETARWFASPRFEATTRLYSARQVVEQRGTIPADYTVAKERWAALVERVPFRQLRVGGMEDEAVEDLVTWPRLERLTAPVKINS